MKLILENVRCFAGRHEHEIRPLTLLVGENSAGKSTFLAMLSSVCSSIGNPAEPHFNDTPYNLGTYDTIATDRGISLGKSEWFSVGLEQDHKNTKTSVLLRYTDIDGGPELEQLLISDGENTLNVRRSKGNYFGQLEVREIEKQFDFAVRRSGIKHRESSSLYFQIRDGLWKLARRSVKEDEQEEAYVIYDRGDHLVSILRPLPTLSIAPIRSTPKRTYEPIRESFSPEGSDIPFILAENISNIKPKRSLTSSLKRFGHESGLFDSVIVRSLGENHSDPFQVLISQGGVSRNLRDVGYGVSQSLPIVVQSILTSGDATLLMQQPEVHLHPKAQAALGSFFAGLVASGSRRFVIETHSDYIIDRVRLEVARGKLKPELVSILYFERHGAETTIHEIEVDQLGNVANAPPTYRSFFLQEELNLLTRAGK